MRVPPSRGLRHGHRRGVAATASLAVTLWAAAAHAQGGEWLQEGRILVAADLANTDCRTGVCKHNENTDLTRWRSGVWLVHRTAESQVRGPNSSLRVSSSRNAGRTFELQAIIPADFARDLRDPHFYQVGRRLFIKAITRLPGFGEADPSWVVGLFAPSDIWLATIDLRRLPGQARSGR